MAKVKNLFDNLVKLMLLKYNFEEKNINFMNDNKNNKNKLDFFNNYMDLIKI